MTEVTELAERISSHSFSPDRRFLAISSCNNVVTVLQKANENTNDWREFQVVEEHTERVTGIDWSANGNRIVTCGADRNAFVWTYNDSSHKWTPEMVVLRMDRAATCCRWSPDGRKFAVGSGSKLVAICYYEAQNNWWASKHIKKGIKSTVKCLAWHPGSQLIAFGACDFKTRVSSTFVKDVDGALRESTWSAPGAKVIFGTQVFEHTNETSGWVNAVGFSADGSKLAWASHDSSVRVADSTSGGSVTVEFTAFLPFSTLIWTTPDRFVAAGYDCLPVAYSFAAGRITLLGKLDAAGKHSANDAPTTVSARDRFRQLDAKKQSESSETGGSEPRTVHVNDIKEIRHFVGDAAACTKFSSIGHDGKLVIWNLQQIVPDK